MAEVRDAARKRAEARDRRRSMASKPFEQLDERAQKESGEQSSTDGDSGRPQAVETAKRALTAAAAAAAAGALAGAAKALIERRAEDGGGDEEPERKAEHDGEQDEPEARAEPQPADEEEDEPEARAEPQPADEEEDEPEAQAQPESSDDEEEDEPEAQAQPESSDDEEEDEPEAQAEPEPDDEQPEEQDDEPQSRAEPDREDEDDEDEDGGRAQDGSLADPGKLVRRARKQLEELLGHEPEGVSGIRQGEDGWTVTLEVVELRRVPDSMDVLSSYEVTLDEDGRLKSFERKRRYRRSEVEAA
jgi:hypothetical protein